MVLRRKANRKRPSAKRVDHPRIATRFRRCRAPLLAAGPTVIPETATQAIYYSPWIAGGANDVTVAFSQPATYPDIRIAEYSGLVSTNALDSVGVASGNSITSSASLTTTNATDLLVTGKPRPNVHLRAKRSVYFKAGKLTGRGRLRRRDGYREGNANFGRASFGFRLLGSSGCRL